MKTWVALLVCITMTPLFGSSLKGYLVGEKTAVETFLKVDLALEQPLKLCEKDLRSKSFHCETFEVVSATTLVDSTPQTFEAVGEGDRHLTLTISSQEPVFWKVDLVDGSNERTLRGFPIIE